jgi:hypothetical protein
MGTGALLVVLAGLFLSCAVMPPSTNNPYRKLKPGVNLEVVGTAQAKFEASGTGIFTMSQINKAGYIALMEAAKREHNGNIDIYDIVWSKIRVVRDADKAKNQVVEYSANGRVVLIDSKAKISADTGVVGALERAAEAIAETFPADSRIAIVHITAEDRSLMDYITGELEHILRTHSYIMIDRSELDKLRAEQQFGASGEVTDQSAAKIGAMVGASVVITGRVDGEGNLRRLRLRVLETSTGQVLGTASERL